VRAEDVTAVQDRAQRAAREDAEHRAYALATNGEELIVLDAETRMTTVGAPGEVRAQVEARGVVTITAVLVRPGELRARATAALDRLAAANGRTVLRARPETFRTRVVTNDPTHAAATVSVHLEGDVVIQPGAQSFEPNRIAGFTSDGVRTYLRSIPGVQDVEVRFWPFWVQRVPNGIGTVDVEIRAPNP
jgi:hypothetical protein